MFVTVVFSPGADPLNPAVLLEDSVAVVGVGVAGVAVTATYVTGDPVYDAIGSIAVGGMLVRVDLNPALVLALTLSRTLARTRTL